MVNKDYHKFWKSINKKNNEAASAYATSIGGVSGESDIADMWMKHFKDLYNSVPDNDSKTIFFEKVKAFTTNKINLTSQFDLVDIIDALNRQKNGKAVGPDNIAMEALKFDRHRLYVHICLLFNLFIKHCYIPTAFMQSIVIPLDKARVVINPIKITIDLSLFLRQYQKCLSQ